MPTVTLIWGTDDQLTRHVPEAMAQPDARTWLDGQYVALECVPLRASGKVLVADKLLSIADAAGPAQFADAQWADRFAAAAAGSTGRDTISIDVPGRAVRF